MKVNLTNVSILLNEPHFPENIGAAARVVKNMGLGGLVVVRPYDCDLTKILKMATHNAEDVVADMEVYDDFRDALLPFQYVVGTTARKGSQRQALNNPRRVAQELVPISRKNRVAVVFGTESSGLANNELKFCDSLVTIPTADFSSLNLAQAVMVLGYEIFMASVDEPKTFVPRLATRKEMEGMYDHLQDVLARIHFINPENPDYWMRSIRRFFSRIGIRAREVKIVRGICRQMDWYCDRRLESGNDGDGDTNGR
ncbi:MAG: RNA methyltransferase [Syntrophobacteraceae bacterium]|nr:RNA methyltransferase [Desulfobacteraceae bacterium]